jgi:hypothetical protein
MFNQLDYYELDCESSFLGLRHFTYVPGSLPAAVHLISRIERGREHG